MQESWCALCRATAAVSINRQQQQQLQPWQSQCTAPNNWPNIGPLVESPQTLMVLLLQPSSC